MSVIYPELPLGRWRRQKTINHDELSRRAIVWIKQKATLRGMRSAYELSIAPSYVADAVAILSFQARYFWETINEHGIAIGRDSLIQGKEYPPNEFVCVFESKFNRADFVKTFLKYKGTKHENRHSPIGSLHWVVAPKGLVDIKELPDFWGLLEMSGQGLKEIKTPKFFKVTQEFINKVAYEILWNKHKKD